MLLTHVHETVFPVPRADPVIRRGTNGTDGLRGDETYDSQEVGVDVVVLGDEFGDGVECVAHANEEDAMGKDVGFYVVLPEVEGEFFAFAASEVGGRGGVFDGSGGRVGGRVGGGCY